METWFLYLFLRNRSNLAQIATMRGRAADRVARSSVNEQVAIGAHRPERVVAGRADLGAGLPPAVGTNRDPGVEVVVQPGAGAHAARWRLDRHPVAIGNPARLRRRGMELHFGMRDALAQTRQRVVLGLAEQRRFRARQDQWETRR